MNSMPLFSIIIPTYQRNDLLAKCLHCLAPDIQTLPFEQYEVIVTDDGFQTTAQQMIREFYPWAKWVAGSRKGPAANRNNGAKYACGEWLVFTDDDCLPDSHWLEAYAQAKITQQSYLVFEGELMSIAQDKALQKPHLLTRQVVIYGHVILPYKSNSLSCSLVLTNDFPTLQWKM
ncbi:glycosyltransferase family 2 protein [Chroococcidiopsis sp. CCNUC1]|uniref:glycosyltransferase family 2 protein n=1 Tax=Chroococcidiopsis sp. CCNUC1 TaxID=2653189 RepID=UPI002022407A|nr:glycosyltransferase family A protein [Chroococcidiopsis sp. CCNUC1]URD49587.1 glycosyltransferase family 2 protein [Chroococcidiopsis sp. CCNUC1]